MSVNAVSAAQADSSQQVTQKTELAEKSQTRRNLENYHSGDGAVAPTASPSGNLGGQVVGRILSERA